MINDSIKVTGQVKLVLVDKDGNVKQTEQSNLVVTTGKAFMANALVASSTSPFAYTAVGTGTTAAAVGDTALTTELVRIANSSAVVSTAVTFTTVLNAGVGTGALAEAGLFNQATLGGTMLAHVVFGVINKGALDTLTLTWTVTVN